MMFRNKNLFFKTGFIISSVLFLFWYASLLTNISNGSWTSLLVHFFLISFLTDTLKKVYVKIFGENFISKYGFSLLLALFIITLTIDNFTKKANIKKDNIALKNKINSLLDTCNYYEAKVYENAILFKPKNDNNDYLASKEIKPYATFESLKYSPKYNYLVSSFIKCPKDSSDLVYIFDEEGTLSVILKLKNRGNIQLENLKSCLKEF